MKFLAIEQTVPGAQFGNHHPLLRSEAAMVWELYEQGVLREMYFDGEQHTAVLILECMDLNEARQRLESLPLVRSKLITFTLQQLIPYSGFARLFNPDTGSLRGTRE